MANYIQICSVVALSYPISILDNIDKEVGVEEIRSCVTYFHLCAKESIFSIMLMREWCMI